MSKRRELRRNMESVSIFRVDRCSGYSPVYAAAFWVKSDPERM